MFCSLFSIGAVLNLFVADLNAGGSGLKKFALREKEFLNSFLLVIISKL